MNWDSRLDALGVKVNATPNAKWSLVAAAFQDEDQAQGNHIILFTVEDDQGKPCPNVPCIVDWLGRDPADVPTRVVTDEKGLANVPIYANLDIHKLNGPYFAYLEGQTVSDIIAGMGLPEHHHVNYLLTFGPRQAPAAAAPAAAGPATLEQAVRAAAQARPWMPVNNTSSLWKFARTNGLEDQQTEEIEFTFGGVLYVCQVFNLGIVYVKKGDWGNIQVIRK